TDHVSVSIQDSNLCRRYSAVVLNNINVKPSPLWMQLRLRSIGIRPINNVVDITNYVMADIGQPLHAFDRDKLKGDSIIVRTASPQETLTTLDGTSRTLDESMLVIADEHQAIALAGIMGGESSEIDDTTTSVVLESANFEHYNNRKTARKLGLNTEASTRFSKNQDPENTLRALNRAITLLQEYAHATIQTNIIDIYPEKRTEKTITISTDYIIDRIGDPDLTNKTDIVAILRRLDITVSDQDDNPTLTIPTFRPDLTIRADIVEEIARIKGYDNMQLTLPKRDLTPVRTNPHIDWLRRAKRTLATIGCTEVYNYTFVGKELYTKCGVEEALHIELQNPISPETTHLRPYLLPSVIANIDTNRKHFDHVALFELEKGITPATKDDELPTETNRLALALYDHDKHHNYSDIKGMVEQLLSQLHIPEVAFSYVDEEDVLLTMFAKSRRAAVTSRGEVIGYVGELNPDVQVAFGFNGVVGIAEFNA
ncbi:phenylalanine--tRNA ligase subunit beta, partial [candidate division WWE3 bacterium]|nr:phenylalanine--tRNA ligase subunit beta [candidate division WWE3 bacterium]